jgi:transposase-like protein
MTGTVFEHTHLDIRMWLYAINLVNVSRKGISAMQLQRELGMKSYKGAWRMMKQIRMAVAKEEINSMFEAVVEIDETYIGGKPRKSNKHDEPETNENHNKRGRGTDKTPVIGVKERNTGRVHAVVANRNEAGKQLTGKQLLTVLNKVCKNNTAVMTDQFKGYNILDKPNSGNFIRLQVDHNLVYSPGNGMHTNGIESFWALLKREIHGIFHHISIKYLQSYINEFCFRLNYRNNKIAFEKLVALAVA